MVYVFCSTLSDIKILNVVVHATPVWFSFFLRLIHYGGGDSILNIYADIIHFLFYFKSILQCFEKMMRIYHFLLHRRYSPIHYPHPPQLPTCSLLLHLLTFSQHSTFWPGWSSSCMLLHAIHWLKPFREFSSTQSRIQSPMTDVYNLVLHTFLLFLRELLVLSWSRCNCCFWEAPDFSLVSPVCNDSYYRDPWGTLNPPFFCHLPLTTHYPVFFTTSSVLWKQESAPQR